MTVRKESRSPWRSPGRRLLPSRQGMPVVIMDKDNFSSNANHHLDENILVDRLSNVQEDLVRVLKYGTVDRQKELLVDGSAGKAVTHQDFKNVSDYWAKDYLGTGEGVHQEDPHHLGVLQEPPGEPGHVVQEEFGHMMDKPGKENVLHHSNISVPGQPDQITETEQNGGDGEQQHHGGVQDDQQQDQEQGDGGVHHRGVNCALVLHGGAREGELQHHRRERDDQLRDQVHGEGGVPPGGVQHEGVDVLAKVKDGFGGEKQKRSYWRKIRGVPDGLVQQRIFEFFYQ